MRLGFWRYGGMEGYGLLGGMPLILLRFLNGGLGGVLMWLLGRYGGSIKLLYHTELYQDVTAGLKFKIYECCDLCASEFI